MERASQVFIQTLRKESPIYARAFFYGSFGFGFCVIAIAEISRLVLVPAVRHTFFNILFNGGFWTIAAVGLACAFLIEIALILIPALRRGDPDQLDLSRCVTQLVVTWLWASGSLAAGVIGFSLTWESTLIWAPALTGLGAFIGRAYQKLIFDRFEVRTRKERE